MSAIVDKSIQIFERSDFLKSKLNFIGLEPEDLRAAQDYCQPYVQLVKSISNSHNTIFKAEKPTKTIFQYFEFALDCGLHVDKFFSSLERRKPQEYVESDDEKYERLTEYTFGHRFRYIDDYIHQYLRLTDEYKLKSTLDYGGNLYVEIEDRSGNKIVLRTLAQERQSNFEMSMTPRTFSLRDYKGFYDWFYFPSREYLNEIFRPAFHTWFAKQMQGQNLKFVEKFGELKLLFDDLEEETVETKQAKEFAETISKYFDHKMHRSYLFYGPPGSGKSNLMRGIAKELKLPYLRLDKSSISYYNDIISILNEVKVSCVLVDDIDWMDKNAGMQQLLHLLGSLNSMVTLLLGSANYVRKLPGALKRPERFDRTYLIQFLDSEVHLQMVNQDEELYQLTQNWPAVFIKELMKRVKVEGKEKALSEMNDLQERVDELLAEKYSNAQKETNEKEDDFENEELEDEEDDLDG
jgi:chromosomal replication initiation ATPase DnaA